LPFFVFLMRSCFGFERLKRFMFLSSGRFNQIVHNKSVSGRIVMVEEIFRMAAPDFNRFRPLLN